MQAMRPIEIRSQLADHAFFHASVGEVDDVALLALAEALGRVAVDRRDPRPVRSVSPREAGDARPNTLSSRHGLGTFPFHTDTAYWREPATLLMLYCVDPGAGGRETVVSDTRTWRLTRDERTHLARSLWRVDTGRRAFLEPLAVESSGTLRIRFDRACMQPVGSESATAGDLVGERAVANAVPIRWAAGDLLVLDNRIALHARTAAACADLDRTLKRILVVEP